MRSQSPELISKPVTREEDATPDIKILTERLSAALLNVSLKEDLAKQHAKVAEESITVRDNNDGLRNDMIRGNDGGSSSSNSWLNSSTYHYSPAIDDDDQSQQQRRRVRLQKMRSLVDTRTQVLHRSLMELINRRRGRRFNMNVNELQHQPSTDFLRRS